MKNVRIITEQVLVPLGAAVAAIGGAAFWLASLSGRVEASEKQYAQYETFMNQTLSIMRTVDERVSRIEGKLDQMREDIYDGRTASGRRSEESQ